MGAYRVSWLLLVALLCYTPILGNFIPTTNFGAGIPDLDPLRVLAYLLVMAFLAEVSVYGGVSFLHRWLGIVFSYVAIVCASPLWSKFYTYDTVVVQELFNAVFLPAVIAGIAIVLFRDARVVQRYCLNVTIASIILSLISLAQFARGTSIIHGQSRSMATFDNPNLLAIYLVLSLAVVLYGTNTGKVSRRLGQLAQLLLVLAMFTTVSRKGMATMIVTFGVFFVAARQYRQLLVGAIVLTVLGMIAAGISQISTRFTGAEIERQIEGKAMMAMAGLEMFADKPIIGHGYKGYYQNFGKYLPNAGRDKYDAHNEYVTALANFGVLGFIPFILIFIWPLSWAWKRLRRLDPRTSAEARPRLLVGILSILTFMLNQFYAGHLFYSNLAVFLLYGNIALMLTTSLDGQPEMSTAGNLDQQNSQAVVQHRILRYRAGVPRK